MAPVLMAPGGGAEVARSFHLLSFTFQNGKRLAVAFPFSIERREFPVRVMVHMETCSARPMIVVVDHEIQLPISLKAVDLFDDLEIHDQTPNHETRQNPPK